MKRIMALLLAASILLTAAAGCSSETEDKSKILKIGSEADVTDLYGIALVGGIGWTICTQMLYDQLVHFNDKENKIELRLAESYEYNEDNTVLTFNLRKGIKFHNGNDFTADDVVFSYAQYTELGAEGAFSGVSGCRAVDDYTVAFDLEYMYAPLLTSYVTLLNIVDKEYYDEVGLDEYCEKPVGCGPYKFVSWEKASNVTFAAYEDYYRGEAPIKDVEVIFMTDATARSNAIEVGDVDITTIASSGVELLESKEDIVILDSYMPSICGPCFNLNNEYFSNVKVRQAIAYAIDRDFMVESAHPGGRGGVASSIWMSNYAFGYSDDISPAYNYDVDKAKQLMEEAGYADGFDGGEIICNAGGATPAEVLQNQLGEIGIKTTIRVLETAALYEATTSGNFTIAFLRVGYPGADTATSDVYITTGGGANFMNYSNARVDELYALAEREPAPEKRIEYYTEAGSIIQEEVPWVQCYAMSFLVACDADLDNLFFSQTTGWQIYDFSWKTK